MKEGRQEERKRIKRIKREKAGNGREGGGWR